MRETHVDYFNEYKIDALRRCVTDPFENFRDDFFKDNIALLEKLERQKHFFGDSDYKYIYSKVV